MSIKTAGKVNNIKKLCNINVTVNKTVSAVLIYLTLDPPGIIREANKIRKDDLNVELFKSLYSLFLNFAIFS